MNQLVPRLKSGLSKYQSVLGIQGAQPFKRKRALYRGIERKDMRFLLIANKMERSLRSMK